MSVTVETLEKLERKITLSLPLTTIQTEVDSRLKRMARTVKMDGFRPGKVPMNVVTQRYGYSVQYEVLNDKVGEAFAVAANEAKLRSEERLRQFRSDELDIKERSQLLQHLQASGILGEERRLDWTEQLGNTQRELRIPGMKYEFAPQTALQANGSAGYNWFNSPLRLQLRLVHEGDLLNFLDRLQHEGKALVIVRSCKLALPPATSGDHETTAALNAECELDWLTAQRLTGKG